MKLLHHLIPFTLAACGTTTEQPSGCQIDSDCKEGRVCLEGMCQEPIRDAGVNDAESLDASRMSPLNGHFYFTGQAEGEDRSIFRYDLSGNEVERFKDNVGGIFTPTPNKRLLRAVLSPSLKDLVYLEQEEDSFTIQHYDLNTGSIVGLGRGSPGTHFAWGDESTLFYTNSGTTPEGLKDSAVYKITISHPEPIKMVFFPVTDFPMGVAATLANQRIAFTCPPQAIIRQAEQDNEYNPAYVEKLEICVGSYDRTNGQTFTRLTSEQQVTVSHPTHIWDEFYGSNNLDDSLLKVLTLCKRESSPYIGVCAAFFTNIQRFEPFIFIDGAHVTALVPNSSHRLLQLSESVVVDRMTNQRYEIPFYENNIVEGKRVRDPIIFALDGDIKEE